MTRPLPPVLDAAGLARLDPPAVLVDVRWYLDGRSGSAAYAEAHLPGAVFLDLERWLTEPGGSGGGRHPLPSPETFTEGLSRAGVGDQDAVVAYDDAGGLVAGRLVWLLRATGRDAALLDGGLRAWQGPVDTSGTTVVRPRTHPEVRPWPTHLLAGLDEVAGLGGTARPGARPDAPGGEVLLLDSRPPKRYRGEHEPVDPRAGHVPGAVNLPAAAALQADGRLRDPDELREAFAAAGAGTGVDVVASCGSGVTACFTLLLLEHVGLPPGRLWPGSFSEWAADPDRPVATGTAP